MNAPTRPHPLARRYLVSGAVVIAVGLLLAYVHLCRSSVEDGVCWRAEQRALANAGTMMAKLPTRP